MIKTLLEVGWINLKRDRVALILSFALPIAFFSFFAMVFAGRGGSGARPAAMDVVILDLDGSTESGRLLTLLENQEALRTPSEKHRARVANSDGSETPPQPEAPSNRDAALEAVRSGAVRAAVIIPTGFAESLTAFDDRGEPVEVIFDAANPMAEHVVTGMVQAASFQAAPTAQMKRGLRFLEAFGGPLTPVQKVAMNAAETSLESEADAAAQPGSTSSGGDAPGFEGLVPVTSTPARKASEANQQPSIIPYYAAGIAVMFLLFSMTGAAGGLLEAAEFGILDRMLASRVGMGRLLTGNWLFFTLMGAAQVMAMFIWAAFAFDLALFVPQRIISVIVLATITAAAAAAFGLVLATLCRTRGQLSGISTVTIILLSALGGSMVPRFVMPESIARLSKLTFNGWALDGFLKIFWYDDPDAGILRTLASLLPEIGVLLGTTAVLLFLARRFARRWETA